MTQEQPLNTADLAARMNGGVVNGKTEAPAEPFILQLRSQTSPLRALTATRLTRAILRRLTEAEPLEIAA